MFKKELSIVPRKPGSYQMFNQDNVIIYIGKAKNLKSRLSSYFNRALNGKTALMVSEVHHFKYVVTSSELESLILELNLIKKYNPKYNILLKDDKSYPYIEYISKPYPKLKVVRYLTIKRKDNRKLFGPFPNAYAARRIVNLLNRLYPLKKCEGNPKEVCLYYHINECLGYCVKKIDSAALQKMEHEIIDFLRGNEKFIKDKIMKDIEKYSEILNYEKALELKKELEYMNIILSKQKVELDDLVDRDIISYYSNEGFISTQIFFIRHGKLVGTHDDIFTIVDNTKEELEYYIGNFYSRNEIPNEILIDSDINSNLLEELLKTKIIVPIKGKKKKLIDMAKMNAKLNLENHLEIKYSNKEDANEKLKEVLNLDNLYRIDVFDNSNLFGSYYVSGMVVFKNGSPSKKDYRKYKIESETYDDYNAMKEVIYRRYQRMLMESSERPDLILVDGGITQVNACINILESLKLNIRVCGLVKNDKHRTNELLDGNTKEIIDIDKNSSLFHYLGRIQNEVHRYTINYHRQIRSKGSIGSVLDNISGIGNVRKKELIKEFKNIENIKKASLEELEKILPKNIAVKVKNYFNENI